MLGWIKEKIFNKYLGSIVRTALAAFGGYLVSKYELDTDTVDQLIANLGDVLATILPLLVAQVWSLIQKKTTK